MLLLLQPAPESDFHFCLRKFGRQVTFLPYVAAHVHSCWAEAFIVDYFVYRNTSSSRHQDYFRSAVPPTVSCQWRINGGGHCWLPFYT
jgi:hypothetical protein